MLNANEISVGGGGNKPGRSGVYNASGQRVGFIGVDFADEGAWFKQIGIGGGSYAVARLQADSDGNVTLINSQVSVTGTHTEGSGYTTSVHINPSGDIVPMRIFSGVGETWLEDGEVTVVSP